MDDDVPRGPPTQAVHTVRSLEQARLLTDPARLRLLRAFAEGPRTTKQVADVLGEPATRLYRHVASLLDVGLLELVAERPKRGTTERYLRAVARRFEVDQSLFTEAGGDEGGPGATVSTLFAAAEAGVRASLEGPAESRSEALLVGASIRCSEERLGDLRERLLAILEEFECAPGGETEVGDGSTALYGMLVALYEDPD